MIRALALALLLVPAAARAASGLALASQQQLDFGYALLAEGDDYRAIGELKRFVFLAPDAPETFPALLSIGRAYEQGGKAGDGAAWLERLQPLATTPQLRADLLVELGCARFLSGDAGAAVESLQAVLQGQALSSALTRSQRARAQYLLAWSYLFLGMSDDAAQRFADVPLAEAPALADAARGYALVPHKSPLLAGILSAVIPGLGHFYLGMPAIGLAALAWNALFILATVDTFHRHLWGAGAVLAGFEVLWYGGAIFGAVSGAEKYNRDAQLNYLDAMREKYDVAPASWPPSRVR